MGTGQVIGMLVSCEEWALPSSKGQFRLIMETEADTDINRQAEDMI